MRRRRFDSSSSDEEAGDAEGGARHSARKCFASKVMSRIVDYSSSYELLHFAYDFVLWAGIGSKKNTLQGRVPLRVAMKGQNFSPLYWRSVHHALNDLVRQIGLPCIFWTLAPYEWSFPYPEWVTDAMAKALKTRLFLPIGETLGMAHVMLQTVRALICGKQGKARSGADTSFMRKKKMGRQWSFRFFRESSFRTVRARLQPRNTTARAGPTSTCLSGRQTNLGYRSRKQSPHLQIATTRTCVDTCSGRREKTRKQSGRFATSRRSGM